MKCIYLDKTGFCLAHPHNVAGEYKPKDDELKMYCKNVAKMLGCPRLRIYHAYLTASSKK